MADDEKEDPSFADKVISTFAPKLETRNINDNYLITAEQSETRIFWLLAITASILAMIGTSLMFDSKSKVFEPIVLDPQSKTQLEFNPMSRTHIALNDEDGNITDIHFKTNSWNFAWKMKLPKSSSYFAFEHERKMFVAYGDGAKDITYLKSNKFHRTIKKSNIPLKFQALYVTSAKVGDVFWIFSTGYGTFEITSESKKLQSWLWSMKKQKWMKGPSIPEGLVFDQGCILPMQRIKALVFGPRLDSILGNTQMRVLSYDFGNNTWDTVSMIPNEIVDNQNYFNRISCAQLVNKDGEREIIVEATRVFGTHDVFANGGKLALFKDNKWILLASYSDMTAFYQMMLTRNNIVYNVVRNEDDSTLMLIFLDADYKWRTMPGSKVNITSKIVQVVPYVQDNCPFKKLC